MRATALALVGMALAAAVAVAAPPVGDPTASLRGFEYVPPTPRPAEVSPSVVAAWRRLAAAPQEDPVMRARALNRLAALGDPADLALVERLLVDRDEPFLRRKAAAALARLRGPSAQGRLAELLQDATEDPKLREACARALTDLGAAAGPLRRRLAARLPDPTLRALLRDPTRPVKRQRRTTP